MAVEELVGPLDRCPEGEEFWVIRGLRVCHCPGEEPPRVDCLAVVREPWRGGWTVVTHSSVGCECTEPMAALVFEPLDPGTVGFIAAVSRLLAERGVPLLVYSAYDTDYILVPEDRVGDAVSALESAGCVYRGERGLGELE